MNSLKKEEIAELALEEIASEYDISLENCSDFIEKSEKVREFVENHDTLQLSTEIEFELTVTTKIGETIDSLLWEDWFEHAEAELTMKFADNGFESAADVKSISLEEVFDWN